MRLNKKRITVFLLITMLLFLIIYGAIMIKHRMDYAITDAVFVDTEDIHNVGFQRVNGKIIRMTKKEGEEVHKGELLAEIDPRTYQLIVKELKKTIEAKRNKRDKLRITLKKTIEILDIKERIAKDKVKEIKDQIDSLKDKISSLDAQIAQLKRDTRRYRNLYLKGAVAKRTYEKIDTDLISRIRQKKALLKQLSALKKQLSISKKEILLVRANRKSIDELKKQIAQIDSQIKALKERLKNAELDLRYCKLISPIDGRVAKKYRSVGDVVNPGIPVYALIDPKDIYILVLLEETKLKGVHVGCPAKIKIDAYPDLTYKGVVEEILPTSAAKFALVPRDISAGEFTKVVQRMQVKVKITEGDVSKLIVGMGGEIEIKREK